MAAQTDDKFKKVGASTVTTLSAPGKAIGATSINVGSTTNYPTDTGLVVGIRVVDGNGDLVAGTYTEWNGVVTSGTAIQIESTPEYGTDQIYPAGSTTQVFLNVSSSLHNQLVDGILVSHNQDGTLITQAVRDALNLDSGSSDGWTPFGYSLTSITALGNRSYTAVVSGTDTTGVTSVGMRLKLPRTVTAPTYMGGAFNGSSHYFTKVTPTGTLSTITNNFTIMCHIEPTAYQTSAIAGRSDSTPNNGLMLGMASTGQIQVYVRNGGSGNYRILSTCQSVPLNKKTHVAASWTSGTVVIYFDGVSVPLLAAVTAGTAPTVAGTGGDFSIGRVGAHSGEYFPGYISTVGFFDAVLTQATVRLHMNQALTGSETNCIGAWNLNNAATDASAAGNNLTATGGVGYTARSPYTNSVTGTSVTAGTTNYGIIMAQTFSTNTTYTIQIPEGETLPTTGGIGTVSYSTQKTPYGFPGQRGKWIVESCTSLGVGTGATSAGGIYNHSSVQLTVPVGSWKITLDGSLYAQDSAQITGQVLTVLSATAASTSTLTPYLAQNNYAEASGASSAAFISKIRISDYINTTTATPVYANTKTENTCSNVQWYAYASTSMFSASIFVENAYL